MGSNQRKVSVISTHMSVSGAGDFNKGVQTCLVVFVYVIWMCACVQLEEKECRLALIRL